MLLPPRIDLTGGSSSKEKPQTNIQPASANDALLNYSDFYKKYTGNTLNPDSLLGKINNFFTGDESAARQAYENYLAEYEYKRNQAATSAQNELTFAREDTQIQRLLQDYKSAGLNTYMLLNAGNLSSGVSSQASRPTYKRSSYKKEKKSSGVSSAVSSAIRAIALIAMLAG